MNAFRSMIQRAGAALVAAPCVFALSLGILTAPVAQAQPVATPQVNPEVERAVAALRAVSTLQAQFVQTDRDGRRANGVITLKRPGKIRFQYAPGIPMLIVADGAALTFVDYETRQVQRWPIRNSPLGALLDPNRDVAKFGRLVPTGDANWVAIEVRDRSHPEYGIITLRFRRNGAAPGGLELMGWLALDSQNRQTAIQLSGHRYGVAVTENMFRYNDPRGPAHR